MFEFSQSELFGIAEPAAPAQITFTYDVLERMVTQSFLDADGAVLGTLEYAYYGSTNNVETITRVL